MQGVGQMVARAGQIIHDRGQIRAQLLGVFPRPVQHLLQRSNLLAQLPFSLGRRGVRQPLGFLLQLRPGPFGAGVGLIDLPPQPLALPVKLPCGALCGRQKLLLRLLQGFFKIGQFVGHSGISHGQVLSAP